MRSKGKRVRVAAALWLLLGLTAVGCAQGGGGEDIEFEAVLNGTELSDSSGGDPITIDGNEPAELELTMTNVSEEPVTVRYVRFEGEVLNMIFLTYDTAVSIDIAPGDTESVPPVLLDFYDLGGQANGYLRGHVSLYDGDREQLGSEQVFLDAGGDGFSTLSLFNLLLLLATVAGAAWNLLRLSQRRLPPNRMVRAMRFLVIGIGAGLTIAVAFSTLRIWPLSGTMWVLITAVAAVIGYAVGFVLPGADDELVDILDEQDVLDAALDARSKS